MGLSPQQSWEVLVPVSYCYVTDHLKTPWLSITFTVAHMCGSLGAG